MTTRKAQLTDKETVLNLLDEFRADCMEQVTGQPGESHSARTGGAQVYEQLLSRPDYCMILLIDDAKKVAGVVTGYISVRCCAMVACVLKSKSFLCKKVSEEKEVPNC